MGPFSITAVASLDAHIAGQYGQHADRTGGLLSVGMALRPPALGNVSRFGHADFPGQLKDALGWDTGYRGSPDRGFRGAVWAAAQNVILVTVARGDTLGHGGLIIAHAITVQKILVHQVFGH